MQEAGKPIHRRWKSRILAQGAFLFVAGALQADITLPVQAPPQADPQSARVLRGQQTTILLRGHSGSGGSLTFRIVQRPKHGTLSPVRLLGDNRAEIAYENDGAELIEGDHFRYVVKANDGRISSPAEVRILVEDVPAKMVVPARIEFDEIEAGTSQSRVLSITNEGAGILEGRLSVSAPWRLSAAVYRVGAGRTENVSVRFEPDEGRQFVGQITLAAANGIETIVQLTGAAISPVQAVPDHLEISGSNNYDGAKRGSVALTNQTGRALTLRLDASSNIQSVSELTFGPHERKTVSIAVLPKWSGAFHEDVAFVGNGFRVRLPVDAAAPAIPPVVTIAKATPSKTSTVQPATTVSAATSNKIPSNPGPLRVDASTASAAPRPSNATSVAVKVKRLDASHWELRWPQPTGPVTKYRVDERLVSLDHAGGLQTSWREIAPVETVALGNEVVAQIKGVEPNSRHLVRVTAFGPSDVPLWESPVTPLTPATGSLRFQPPWLTLLEITLVVFVVLRWRANRAAA
jgi:hypothetical protein